MSDWRYAIYRDFTVLGGGDPGLIVGSPGPIPTPIPSTIHIQLADGSTVALKDLPESVAARELEKSDSRIIRPGNATYRKGPHTLLYFTQGKLIYAWIDHSWVGIKVGSNPNGPFYKLPLTREQIVELFGEPLEWRSNGKVRSRP